MSKNLFFLSKICFEDRLNDKLAVNFFLFLISKNDLRGIISRAELLDGVI